MWSKDNFRTWADGDIHRIQRLRGHDGVILLSTGTVALGGKTKRCMKSTSGHWGGSNKNKSRFFLSTGVFEVFVHLGSHPSHKITKMQTTEHDLEQRKNQTARIFEIRDV